MRLAAQIRQWRNEKTKEWDFSGWVFVDKEKGKGYKHFNYRLFENAYFPQYANFRGAVFKPPMNFGGAKFKRAVEFSGATFESAMFTSGKLFSREK